MNKYTNYVTSIVYKLTFSLNPEENWQANGRADNPVSKDPLVLPVKLVRKLADLGRESIRILHGPVGYLLPVRKNNYFVNLLKKQVHFHTNYNNILQLWKFIHLDWFLTKTRCGFNWKLKGPENCLLSGSAAFYQIKKWKMDSTLPLTVSHGTGSVRGLWMSFMWIYILRKP